MRSFLITDLRLFKGRDLFFLKKENKVLTRHVRSDICFSPRTLSNPIQTNFSITKTKENLSEGERNITDFYETCELCSSYSSIITSLWIKFWQLFSIQQEISGKQHLTKFETFDKCSFWEKWWLCGFKESFLARKTTALWDGTNLSIKFKNANDICCCC